MTLPPKIITVLCLVQFFFVSAGFLVTRATLKLYDKVVPELRGSYYTHQIPPLPQFVRYYGLWFLFVPLLWCVIAAARGRVADGGATIALPQIVPGIALTVALVLFFTLTALYAIRISFGAL